ncbi:MAG: preprotein translocase subunit SecE [Oscillospiraceae bacterium]|nr:preprotein translocase subunit SecE [Oscillospiraceae bacterium]
MSEKEMPEEELTSEEELNAQEAPSEPAEDAPAPKPKKTKEEKEAEKKTKEKAQKKKKGNRVVRWFREMRSELKKVQWPGWKQVLKNTGIVLLCVLVIGVFIWIFDALVHRIIDALINLFS